MTHRRRSPTNALPRRGVRFTRSKWFLPVFSVLLGIVMLAALWAGGHRDQGLESLAIMFLFAIAVLLGGGSETIRGLRGDGRDERFTAMDRRATGFVGITLIVAVIAGFLVEVAEGRSGAPYTWLGALAGLAYVAAIVIQRVRG